MKQSFAMFFYDVLHYFHLWITVAVVMRLAELF